MGILLVVTMKLKQINNGKEEMKGGSWKHE